MCGLINFPTDLGGGFGAYRALRGVVQLDSLDFTAFLFCAQLFAKILLFFQLQKSMSSEARHLFSQNQLDQVQLVYSYFNI